MSEQPDTTTLVLPGWQLTCDDAGNLVLAKATAMIDTVTLEVLHQKLKACTEEMAIALSRAARSTYVKDAADFATALANTRGKSLPIPKRWACRDFSTSIVAG